MTSLKSITIVARNQSDRTGSASPCGKPIRRVASLPELRTTTAHNAE